LRTIFEPLLDSEDTAKVLRIHPQTLQKLARNGEIQAVRIGKLWRFPGFPSERLGKLPDVLLMVEGGMSKPLIERKLNSVTFATSEGRVNGYSLLGGLEALSP
jgi:excisionase family DNA binding protein